MFVGSVDQERKAYIHLLLYPHGSDITSQDPKYVQSITIYTGFTRSHALHQSAPSSSPGRGIPLRCTRSLLLGPLLVTARNGDVNHPSLYSHITQLMLYALLHISLTILTIKHSTTRLRVNMCDLVTIVHYNKGKSKIG